MLNQNDSLGQKFISYKQRCECIVEREGKTVRANKQRQVERTKKEYFFYIFNYFFLFHITNNSLLDIEYCAGPNINCLPIIKTSLDVMIMRSCIRL